MSKLSLICLCLLPITSIAQLPAVFEVSIGEAKEPAALAFAAETDGFLLTPYASLTEGPHGTLSSNVWARRVTPDDIPDVWIEASIIGVEPILGLGILKVELQKPVPALTSKPPASLEPGEPIQIVSYGPEHRIVFHEGYFLRENSLDCYQLDMTAAMFKGVIEIPETALGSPVFQADGSVLAIHTGYQPGESNTDDDDEPEHTHHFVPISLAQNVYTGIKQRGNLESPWTGYSVRNLNEAEKRLFPAINGQVKGGVTIEGVLDNSPAAKLGIQQGDILVKFGHYPISSVNDFQKWLYMYGVGFTVNQYFLKGDTLSNKRYTIEARPLGRNPK